MAGMAKKDKDKPQLSLVPSRADGGILGKDGKCNALKRDQSGRCTLPAGQGTDHKGYGACQYHGGNSPSLQKHAVKAEIRDMAQELDMDPHDALLWTVRMAAGMVKWLQERIAELEDPLEAGADERAAIEAILQIYRDSYGEERDRLARHAKLAIDAGIDERRIALEEEQGELIARAIRGILDDLQLTPEQKRSAPAIARRHLMALSAG